MKLAYNTETWKPNLSARISSKPATRPYRRARQKPSRTEESEEDEVQIGPFPYKEQRPPVDHIEPRTPPSLAPDTPDSVHTSPVQSAEIVVKNHLEHLDLEQSCSPLGQNRR